MSKNKSSDARPKVDQRIRRTREALGTALMELMHQKSYEAISVQEILARAKVSRSTFYQHYSDKDDLFMSYNDQFFEYMSRALSLHMNRSSRVVAVREFLAHMVQMRNFYAILVANKKYKETFDLCHGHFVRGIEERLLEVPRARGLSAVQRTAVAHAHAGALISLIHWWMERERPFTPAEMDDLYHHMFWSGVNGLKEAP